MHPSLKSLEMLSFVVSLFTIIMMVGVELHHFNHNVNNNKTPAGVDDSKLRVLRREYACLYQFG